MNRERLELQIDVLERVVEFDRLFDMSMWINKAETACRTACCAFGHAALDPRMQAEGLSMNVSVIDAGGQRWVSVTTLAEYNALVKRAFEKGGTLSAYPLYTDPNGAECDAFDAAMCFFGITADAASYLFDPDWYPDKNHIAPEDVIERVREVIALEGGAPQHERTEDDDDETEDDDDDERVGFVDDES